MDFGLFLLRLAAGAILVTMGSLKLFTHGFGYEQIMTSYRETLSFFQTTFGIGPFFATLAIIAEFFGGVGLIVGFLSRLSAFGTSCTMAVATYMSYGAAMAQLKAGKVQTFAAISQFAFPALIFVVSFVILINGAGSISLDYAFFGKRRR